MRRAPLAMLVLTLTHLAGCGGGGGGDDAGRADTPPRDAGPPPPTAPTCDPGAMPSATVARPELLATLADRWHESWLASPGVADLDGDGENEIVIARAGRLLVWHLDGTIVWSADVDGRIWASPVIGDLTDAPGLEVAVSERGNIHVYSAAGVEQPGFPFAWNDELRSLAAGDLDGDGRLELAAVTTDPVEGPTRDTWSAFHAPQGRPFDRAQDRLSSSRSLVTYPHVGSSAPLRARPVLHPAETAATNANQERLATSSSRSTPTAASWTASRRTPPAPRAATTPAT